jgi:ABC-2 type transport system ATP-binding protein
MEHIIRVEGLTKRYKDFTAVDHISFKVQKGEIFGILGPNGAGKTTTLEMMEGLKTITEGDAVINDISVKAHANKVKHIIGVQLQSSSFYDMMNLKELLEFFGSLYGRKVDGMALLKKVSLEDKWKNEAKELSGGQRQRLSIAVALVNNPLVIFLDEPTTGLDPQARRHLWDLVRSIQKEGTTIILTTHYMEEAEVLCERIAIMDSAKIIAEDTPQGLLKMIDQNATVQFQIKDAVINMDDMKKLQAVSDAQLLKNTVTLRTQHVQDTLKALIDYDRAHPVNFTDLQVHETNLEDVFLTLTGKSLRD